MLFRSHHAISIPCATDDTLESARGDKFWQYRGASSDRQKEYQSVATFWELINEIDRWNQRGTVLMEEPVVAPSGPTDVCTACDAKVSQQQNFCPNCGMKTTWAKSA